MRRLFILTIILIFSSTLFSQDYKTGIGLRGGWTSGLTVKHFIKSGQAIEGILSSNWGWRGYRITALYEVHKAAFADDIEGMYWYYGGGIHFGDGGYYYYRWKDDPYYGKGGYYERRRHVAFGIDGILGLEYKIQEIPITLGLDVKPFIDFYDYRDDVPFHFWDSALSIRYVF
jgi:hypothetical protein